MNFFMIIYQSEDLTSLMLKCSQNFDMCNLVEGVTARYWSVINGNKEKRLGTCVFQLRHLKSDSLTSLLYKLDSGSVQCCWQPPQWHLLITHGPSTKDTDSNQPIFFFSPNLHQLALFWDLWHGNLWWRQNTFHSWNTYPTEHLDLSKSARKRSRAV